jgi:glutaredoxin
VVLYTRAGCPLCDKAAAFLEAERRRHDFILEYVDIAADAALTETYGNWVPVVEVDGRIRFRGVINPVLWRRLMEAG